MQQQPQLFKDASQHALADATLRTNFRGAMDFLRNKRERVLDDAEFSSLSAQCEAIKQRCLSQLPALLEQLETRCQANGIQVHWAETPAQANEIIAAIADGCNATSAVKGKSMVTEEIGLNDYLGARGVECLESDMGEFIVQMAHEPPSHIIMPAIHKSAAQIARLFHEQLEGVDYTEDVDTLIGIGRSVLRGKFRHAHVGISGVNFAVAETGTLCLVENEGNGRMCTTVPPVHIAVTGIEKVVQWLQDVPPLLSLLTRSATGQPITTYFNMISGPRRPGEKDGPEQVHLVLLDNGRSNAFADEQLRKTLQCIRCGACMNHCPVYTRIGGHAYGTTYPGPIGKIISPHLLGLDATRDLPTASSLCGACEEVCPVRIPIPQLLQRLRAEYRSDEEGVMSGAGGGRSILEAGVWAGWAWACEHPGVYRLLTWIAGRMRSLVPWLPSAWKNGRTMPVPAARSFHHRYQQRKSRP
ncbi:LutB/LldF family L-lactate oxidation iron-sulfur protein [Simiduia agarivorans]|uniref:Iron-sulfur cluster binding protein n=1 Tax=Simiduia agarivorans (strain DSM 21679 / JCM 13881 / BCRC 17597 / SA1) TaxID=1117647 RepID=K4KN58_SIMAS|nr:LutB/LldF family L-lactate oxidation iron-sulfur protein [Simiduia agarivorans]AFV00472.1 iron-sulfur cluster binding protein [Simiduia agarivorans SA1 = DSM 21679]